MLVRHIPLKRDNGEIKFIFSQTQNSTLCFPNVFFRSYFYCFLVLSINAKTYSPPPLSLCVSLCFSLPLSQSLSLSLYFIINFLISNQITDIHWIKINFECSIRQI